ncbi:SDR family oxidoreductase [Dokdonella sp.]|uniref:SDR family oxidoreductase n=1 Tax=Dokdonella sp. TaxID=2291710 RepID=UPI003C421560
MRLILIALATALAAAPLAGYAQSTQTGEPKARDQKAVLVTGASTGIGRNITESLAAKGYFVYAGARKQADLDALNAIENVQAIRLDVTRQDEIDAAVATVKKAGRGLDGLVNNAGIATIAPITDTSEKEFDLVMQVNAYGPYRVTRAFAPLIIEQKGRITTIGSISGILASEKLGVYAMSKHAVEAFGDALAAQMEPLGVQVSIVEPGNFDSEIGRNATQRSGKETGFADRSQYEKPDAVAVAVEHALFGEKPKRRYMVVPNQQEAEWTIRKQIEQLVQLNEGQSYTYDRATLVKMLDDAMVNARPKSP